jgi:hypothetical protein
MIVNKKIGDYCTLAIIIICIFVIQGTNNHQIRMISAAILFGIGGIFLLQIPIATASQKFAKTAFGNVYKDKKAYLYWPILVVQTFLPIFCFLFTILFLKELY